MKVTKTPEGEGLRIRVAGRLDMASAMALEEELLPEADNCSVFLLDFSELEYISSAGIRTLLALYRKVSPKQGSVSILNACEQVREILEETEFDELFNMN